MDRQRLAVALADETSRFLIASFRRGSSVRSKEDGSLVTATDLTAEQRIVGGILDVFPNDGILAEESGKREGASGIRWYIDPLDGTTNFAVGIPFFATSIGYGDDDGMIGAAIALPSLRLLCTAERGKGAFWNGEKLHVASASSSEKSLLLLSFSDRQDPRVTALLVKRLSTPGAPVRILGSAVASFCLLAAGAAHGYVSLHQHAWDYAAGLLLVREAGGMVMTVDGEALSKPIGTEGTVDLVAAHPDHAAELATSIRSL